MRIRLHIDADDPADIRAALAVLDVLVKQAGERPAQPRTTGTPERGCVLRRTTKNPLEAGLMV